MKKSLAATAVFGFIVSSPFASAQTKVWSGPADGDWNTAGNWTPSGVPTGTDTVFFNNGGSSVIDGASPSRAGTSFIGQGAGNGTVTVNSGGTLTTTAGVFSLGRDSSRNGTLNVNGGTVNVVDLRVADGDGSPGSETGNLSLTSGSLTANTAFTVGYDSGTSGTVTASGGTFSVTGGNATVGREGTGTAIFSGATANVSGFLVVGSSALGTVNLSAGSLTVGSGVQIGVGSTSAPAGSAVNVTGGTLSSTSFINVGALPGNLDSDLNVSGSGQVNWNGTGTNLLSVYNQMSVSGDGFTVSTTGNADGAFNIRGTGTVTFILGASGISMISATSSNLGLVSGAAVTIDGSAFSLGAGTYNFKLVDTAGYASTGTFASTATVASGMSFNYIGFGADYTPVASWSAGDLNLSVTVVPEPSTWALLGLGGIVAVWAARRKVLKKAA